MDIIIKYSKLLTTALLVGLCFASTLTCSAAEFDSQHKQWLINKFSKQHQQLIPIVAVADMFFSCNQERRTDAVNYQLKDLVTAMDKNLLAEKLSFCLGKESIKSDKALNFGLLGCFHQQLASLPSEERQQKMKLVKKAILALSREERQKSFAKCVNAQAIDYLK